MENKIQTNHDRPLVGDAIIPAMSAGLSWAQAGSRRIGTGPVFSCRYERRGVVAPGLIGLISRLLGRYVAGAEIVVILPALKSASTHNPLLTSHKVVKSRGTSVRGPGYWICLSLRPSGPRASF